MWETATFVNAFGIFISKGDVMNMQKEKRQSRDIVGIECRVLRWKSSSLTTTPLTHLYHTTVRVQYLTVRALDLTMGAPILTVGAQALI